MFPQVRIQNVDALAVQRSRYLQETYTEKTGKRPHISERHHYYLSSSFHLQVSERFE